MAIIAVVAVGNADPVARIERGFCLVRIFPVNGMARIAAFHASVVFVARDERNFGKRSIEGGGGQTVMIVFFWIA